MNISAITKCDGKPNAQHFFPTTKSTAAKFKITMFTDKSVQTLCLFRSKKPTKHDMR